MSLLSKVDLKQFAAANNEFAVRLYHELRSSEGNLFFSPCSIRTALAMAYAGARGRTAHQMQETLGLSEADPHPHRAFRAFEETLASRRSGDTVEIDVANALWMQSGFRLVKEFVDTLAADYGSALFEVDFTGAREEACATINRWAAEKTRGKIPELLNPESMDDLARLVLANAIYFCGSWASPFDKRATSLDHFMTELGESRRLDQVSVPMMRQEAAFGYAEDEGLQVLEMPYVGNELSMVFFLPKSCGGWCDFEKKISTQELVRWTRGLRHSNVDVLIPRFQFRASFDLAGILATMGMADAFKLDQADFSGMTPEKPFGISTVIHQAGVEVNEAGTTAFAVTHEIMCLGLPPVFRADHPFIFMIRDIPLDAILFIGRVLNPAA